MADFTDALSISSSGMKAQASRLRYISENVANIDTPGYHRKLTYFEPASTNIAPDTSMPSGAIQLGDVEFDRKALSKEYEPGHPLADADGYVEMSNVDIVIEIADAREAQRSYEANLKMFDQSRQMSSALLDILRR